MPVMGLLLGIVFLNEVADWRLMVGSALIVVGIVVVNWRAKPQVRRAVAASGAD
jgi:drug/metabolite transporter (DMT)-like permease